MIPVEDLGQEIVDLTTRVDVATHRLLECIRQFDESGEWEQGGFLCVEMALVATGAQLERLCRGYGHALSDANGAPPAERSVRRRDLPGGMVKLEIVLLPDEADLVLRALDKAREPQKPETPSDPVDSASSEASESKWPSRADGMVSMAHTFLANPKGHGGAGPGFQVMAHVGQDPLASDGVFAATLEDGTHLSTEALRRVTCDSGMVAVSETGQGMTVGRRTRSIPSAMRRALMLCDHGCRFPGCTEARPVLITRRCFVTSGLRWR